MIWWVLWFTKQDEITGYDHTSFADMDMNRDDAASHRHTPR